MNSILITGCNRGLGLGLVKALVGLPQPPQHLFTTCRNREVAKELEELAKNHSNIHILEIDLRNFDAYDKLISDIEGVTKDQGLNVLFNNAGVAPKSTRITATRSQDLIETLQTNTVVPVMLAKACLPLLKKAAKVNGSQPMGVNRAAIINMSSILGSIQGNTDGGMYAYRTSKTALNAATKSLSIDLYPQRIMCVSLHPGWVRTDMGGSNAPLDVETSTDTIVKTLLELGEPQNGSFINYDGSPLPW
ncbi:C-signal [Drosophila bipectinata]|uniref:C-signal n=1 Tax=Drosophila bipectinata TaxID=42026 RepID=UPI001C892256|nr:C-factor [Drosophila bipectinata]